MTLIELVSAVQRAIEQETGMRCYDAVPADAMPPYCFVRMTGCAPLDTKTTQGMAVEFAVHAVASAADNDSSVELYRMIQTAQACLRKESALSAAVLRMEWKGADEVRTDETREKQAVLGLRIEMM